MDAAVTKELEEEAAAPYREKQRAIDKYEQTLLKAVEDEFPISDALRNSLDNRKRGLGLNDDDVAGLGEQDRRAGPGRSRRAAKGC